MIMDTSVRCTPGESWPYYLANGGCTAGARCSGSSGVYISDISPMGTDFSARYLVTAYGSGHGDAGFNSR
jgi:peptidase E